MPGPNFRDSVSQEQGQSSKILKKSDSRDSGNEEEFEILGQKERHHSGDSGNCSEAEETHRAIELEFQLTQSLKESLPVVKKTLEIDKAQETFNHYGLKSID